MSTPKVLLLTERLHPDAEELLASRSDLFQVRLAPDHQWKQELPNAHICILRSNAQIQREDLLSTNRLEIIGRPAIGIDNIDIETASLKKILVINTPEENVVSTAELSVALLLSAARKLKFAFESMSSGQWSRSSCIGEELSGQTISLIGFGRVGKAVAQRLLGFDMKVQAVDPYLSSHDFESHRVHRKNFEEALTSSDFISLHVPLTKETYQMLTMREFKKMKPTGTVINMSRGRVIKEEDLIKALDLGLIQGAALDVFEKEPTDRAVLLKHPRVVCTPHIGSQTTKARRAVSVGLVERLIEYYDHGTVRSLANKEVLETSEGGFKK
jgi:D-3-phosphoglycerate dehydrogenase